MNTKTKPSILSDMLINNFGHIVNDLFVETQSETKRDFRPALEVCENVDSYSLKLAISGVAKEDVVISQEDRTIKVRGERKITEEDSKKLHSELRYGAFSREIRMPKNANLEAINATYENGLLVVQVAKTVELKPREIEIK